MSHATISFFRGKTLDGHPWVLSYEDGPTATEPERECLVTGLVGPLLSLPEMSITQGAALRELLPCLRLEEVANTVTELIPPWCTVTELIPPW